MQKFTNILVTGGAGFIGSHTCKSLKLRGYQPVVLDNLSRGHGEMVKWGKLVVGDIRDTLLVCEILRAYNIDAVMHFAALANVGESISKPADYYDVNVCGTLSVLNAMREQRVGAIIFSAPVRPMEFRHWCRSTRPLHSGPSIPTVGRRSWQK